MNRNAWLLALALPLNAVGNPYIAAAARQSVQFIDNARAEIAPGSWNGRLEFPGVYCVQFADPDQAASVTTALLDDGTKSLARVEYPPQLSAYVVSSIMPAGRDAEQEHQRQLARVQALADMPAHLYETSTRSSTAGPVLVEQFNNATRYGPGNALFPLERHFYDSDKTLTIARSHSFSRPPQRYEVAVLSVLEPDASPQRIAQVRQQVEDTATQLQHSLQQCSASLPAD